MFQVENRFLIQVMEEFIDHVEKRHCVPSILLRVIHGLAVVTYLASMPFCIHLKPVVIYCESGLLNILYMPSKPAVEAGSRIQWDSYRPCLIVLLPDVTLQQISYVLKVRPV